MELSDSKLAVSVRATGGDLERIREHQCVVLTAGYVEEVLVAVKWTDLGRVDALDGVIGVA